MLYGTVCAQCMRKGCVIIRNVNSCAHLLPLGHELLVRLPLCLLQGEVPVEVDAARVLAAGGEQHARPGAETKQF